MADVKTSQMVFQQYFTPSQVRKKGASSDGEWGMHSTQKKKESAVPLIELIAIWVRVDMSKEDTTYHVLISGVLAPEVELYSKGEIPVVLVWKTGICWERQESLPEMESENPPPSNLLFFWN